jgi:two-component system, NtrC family, sensor histidine kinase KinB
MSIKAKISTALAFLFAVILALGGLSAYYLNRLADDSQAILRDNYESLGYVSAMQRALVNATDNAAARPDSDRVALSDFSASLKAEAANITETGENELVKTLRTAFGQFGAGQRNPAVVGQIRQALFQIDELNRQAIARKNEIAKQTAQDALTWLASVGTLCVLVVFSLIISFPGYVANPLRELTRGIRQVTERNFEERLPVESSDEFGELARSFNSMAQKLDEYEHSSLAQVLFEKRRIDTLIQIMSEGIIGVDENRMILFANPVACRLLGLEPDRLLGKYAPDVAAWNDLMRTLIQDIMAPETASPEAGSLLKIYDPQAPGGGKENYFNKRTHTVEVVRTGEVQPQGAGYVIVLENITSYKELDLAKTNFIATVSHELRTPLSGINMSLKLLDDSRIGPLNDEQRHLLRSVRADTARLLTLTGELLNMAQVESGQIQLNIRPVPPDEIVTYATTALQTQADQKQIRIALALPANLPAVSTDPDKASWVLVNFLANAVRHSPANSQIDVSATREGDTVEFRVRDRGAGIRPEHRDRVFDRYFRAPGANGQASGTGLGLAISKEFIDSLSGKIGLDTTVTNGAAFWFRLPIAGL